MKTLSRWILSCVVISILVPVSSSFGQEFQPYDQNEAFLAVDPAEYPAWSLGLAAGVEAHRDGFSPGESPAFFYQMDSRVGLGGRFHLRALFSRVAMNTIPHYCPELWEGCEYRYDLALNQYQLLLGYHTTVGDSRNNWLQMEAGPALLNWRRGGPRNGDTSVALSLGLNYLWSLSKHFSLDTGLNALIRLENTSLGDLGGTAFGLSVGINYH